MLRLDKNRKRKRTHSFFEQQKRPRVDLHSVVIEQQTPSLTPSFDRGQIFLLANINRYLKSKNRPLFSTAGHCMGLSILWLKKMSEGKVDWFYQVRDKLMLCSFRHLNDHEMEFEKFIALIEWGQNSQQYMTGVSYETLDSLVDENNVENGPFIGTQQDLSGLLRDRRSVIMYLVAGNEHVVAIYQSEGVYHLYDANDESARAKQICCRHEVVREILKDLYTNFEDPIPELLELTVARIRNPYAFKVEEEIKECHHVKKDDIIMDENVSINRCVIL